MEEHSNRISSFPSSLQSYLNQTPTLFEYTFNDATRKAVLIACYQCLWNNDEAFKRSYFAPDDKAFEKLMETGGSSLLTLNRSKRDLLNGTNSLLETSEIEAEYQPSQRGKQCGHVFQKGETVYRCRTCGLDDTCVFCSRCFHSTNHEGHDVSFSVSPGSGGCCDCGDPESWKYEIHCAYHSPMARPPGEPATAAAAAAISSSTNGRDDIPNELNQALHTTIGTVLDFILETFACSPEDKVTAANINSDSQSIRSNAFFRDSQNIKLSLSHGIRPSVFAQTAEDKDEDVTMMDINDGDLTTDESKFSEMYACILWNDESHSYPQVIDQLVSAAGCTEAQAKAIAENVNLYGRDIIKLSTNVDELLNIATSLSTIGLAVTIRTAHDTFREQICTLLLDWLKDLVSGRLKCFESIEQGDAILREVVCDELCSEYTLPPDLAILSLQLGQGRGSDDESEDEPSVDMDFEETGGPQTAIGAAAEEGMAAFDGLDVQPRDLWGMPAHRRRLAAAAISTGPESDSDHQHDNHSSNSESADLSRRHRQSAYYRANKRNALKRYDIADLNWDYNALLNQYNELAEEEALIHDEMSAKIFKSTAVGKKVAEGILGGSKLRQEYERKLRLDYLMLFDLRLWKEVRLALRQLFISSLAPRPDFKKQIAIRLARNYVTLADAFLLRDREPENSIILFSVQLLTVPTIASLVVNECHFLGQICSVLSSFFLTDCVSLPLITERKQGSMRVNCEARSFRSRRYFSAFHDLRYIINTELVKESIIREPLYLRQYIGLIIMFQDMNALVRQADTHIEYESETWVNAFNVTLQIAKCCRQFSECYAMTSNETGRVDECKALVRAILRILRVFSDWIANDAENELTDAAELSNKERQPQPRIAGIQEQEYHTVELNGIGSYWVIKYDVASRPVSFHHPLHWLLAGLLENIGLLEDGILAEAGWNASFVDLIRGTDQCRFDFIDDRRLLAILEYPIRTIVLLSQIRAGVWVRNGYGVRNQAHHYREISLRENTFDADVFLVQLGFAVVDPDILLATLLDRFQLVSWFTGHSEHDNYDASQLIFMVEELLNLLIVCVGERANVTGMTLEQKVQREIIHSLCLGPLPHSDLVKSIPDRLHENFAFDTILSSVAHLKQPEGLNDLGQYELINEYFDEVDPYFWHYTRNNREEAEEVLRKKSSLSAEEYFYLPKLPQVTRGPFAKMGNLLHSKVFVHIIYYALYNTKQGKTTGKSDTVLDQALHLLLMAMVDESNDYVQAAAEDGGQAGFVHLACTLELASERLTLLQLLLQFIDSPELKDTHPRCKWVVNQMEARGSQQTKEALAAWRQQQQTNAEEDARNNDAPSSGMSERDRQKQLVKERQAKILAQFAQAQSQFLEQHEDLYEDDDDEFASIDLDNQDDLDATQESLGGPDDNSRQRHWAYPAGTCIVCQEDAHERSQQYGILCLIQTSNILREFPADNDDILNDVLEHTLGHGHHPELDSTLTTDPKIIRGFPRQSHKSGMYASTCGHLMHVSCFDTYCASIDVRHQSQPTRNQPENTSRREFVCPLCKSLGNALLPIAWKSKRESYPGLLNVAGDEAYAAFLQQDIHRLVEDLGGLIKSNGHGRQRRRGGGGAPSRYREGFTSLSSSSLRVENLDIPITNVNETTRLITSPLPLTFSQPLPPTPLSGLNFGSGGNAPNPLGPFGNEILNSTNMELGPISKTYAQLSEVMRLSCQALSLVCGDKTMEALRLSNFVKNVDLLWSLYGFTISTVEIALRSQKVSTVEVGNELTNTIMDYMAPQMQMLLRILPETIVAFTSVRNSGLSNDPKLNLMAVGRVAQLYPSIAIPRSVTETSIGQGFSYQNPPLLLDDSFLVLAELSLYFVTILDVPVHHLMRLLYLAEIVKTTIGIMQAMKGRHPTNVKTKALLNAINEANDGRPGQPSAGTTTAFVAAVMEPFGMSHEEVEAILHVIGETAFFQVLQTFVLPYVRKCLILMVTRHGLLLPASSTTQADWTVQQELEHLCDQLRLPKLDLLLDRRNILPEEQSLVHEWCCLLANEPSDQQAVPLNLPITFNLVKLPRRLDELFEISLRCVCHRCGTIPNDPSLCLLCGTFVCSQSYCCSEGEYGECNLHQSVCGGEIGIYLDVKRCVILLLRTGNGCFINAPYLDWHGEVDLGLKRGRPQFLNQKRYDDIVKLWLQHNIPVYVGRKLEATYDCGGWETM